MANKLITLCFVLYCGVCFATPSISTISSSSISDNDSISLTGSGFGTNSRDIEWLGGSSGNIESGTVDAHFTKTGWTTDSDSGQFTSPVYSNTYAHSGSQSILSRVIDGAGYCPDASDNCIGSSLEYTASTESGGYMTWWTIFHDGNGVQQQWKIWRVMCTGGVNVDDNNTHLMSSQWYNADRTYLQAYSINYYECGLNSNSEYNGMLIYQDTWTRFEIIVAPGTPGHFTYRSYRGNGSAIYEIRDEDINLSSTNMKYWMLQNYVGNHAEGETSNATIYMDDIYISIGTQARVEIADTSTWASRTHSEVQYPTAWDDNGVTFTVNQGSFENDSTAYVFVIDEDGSANATGEEITFGAASESTQSGKSTLNSNNPKSIITSKNGLTLLK